MNGTVVALNALTNSKNEQKVFLCSPREILANQIFCKDLKKNYLCCTNERRTFSFYLISKKVKLVKTIT